jgi:hypothetical protein
MLHKTLIALTAAVALGCLPMATNALAGNHRAGHAVGGHAVGGHARGGHFARYGGGYRAGGPIYDSCAGYGPGYGYNDYGYNGYGYNNGCPGYGVPLVDGVIGGILGGYGPF